MDYTSWVFEEEFSEVGPGCDSTRFGSTSHALGHPQDPWSHARLLSKMLEIGFRLAVPDCDPRLVYTPGQEWMFETAFSSDNDEVIADAICAWVAGGCHTSLGSCVGYFAKRIGKDTPFSPRLRQVSIRAIEHIWQSELKVSVLGTIYLLDCLNANVDDVVDRPEWVALLVEVICSPVGFKSLSSHYWHLLDKLALELAPWSTLCNVEVMRLLEEAEDWERLEVWMVITWLSIPGPEMPKSTLKDIEQVTIKLLLQQPSALPRFEDLHETDKIYTSRRLKLQWICKQAQVKQSPSEPPLP